MSTRWLTDAEQAVWRDFLVVSHEVEAELDRQLQASVGMTQAHYGILVALSEAPDGQLRMGEIAERMFFSPSRLAHAAKAIEAKGLIERRDCADDRRGHFAAITEAGWDAISSVAPAHVEQVRDLIFADLSGDELDTFGRVLRRIRDRLDD